MVPEDYMGFVCRTKIDPVHRDVMARLALNQLFDADHYRVCLQEVMLLPFEERTRARSFMEYCAIHPLTRSSYTFSSVEGLMSCLEVCDVSR